MVSILIAKLQTNLPSIMCNIKFPLHEFSFYFPLLDSANYLQQMPVETEK